MGLKAALLVVTAGVGAYYAYTMMTSSETGEDGEVTRAHAVPGSGTMHVSRPIASARALHNPKQSALRMRLPRQSRSRSGRTSSSRQP